MAAIDKLTERFKRIPSDFTWDELTRLLARFGYAEHKGKGLRRKFKGERLPTLILHDPHPGRIVKQYALRYVKEALESEGLTKDMSAPPNSARRTVFSTASSLSCAIS